MYAGEAAASKSSTAGRSASSPALAITCQSPLFIQPVPGAELSATMRRAILCTLLLLAVAVQAKDKLKVTILVRLGR